MAYIKSRKHAPVHAARLHPCASAALTLLALPAAVYAQTAPETPAAATSTQSTTLPAVKAKAQIENDYKADVSANPKYTQPLVDTPQTITVIKKELLKQQGATSLSEALRNTPGITFQMGENGNTQTGDSIFMRGFDTQQSIFVDGIRDVGTISRDVFNLEQIEVVKGPAGADIGRGSPTGYVNLSTKVPVRENFSSGSLTFGSADKKRLSLDVNRAVPSLGDGTAFRLNLMVDDADTVGRDVVDKKSWGFAPSLALGLNTPTRTYIYYLHMEQEGRPDGGIPTVGLPSYFNASAAINSAPPVDTENYYGSLSDHNNVKADMVTVRFENDLTPDVTLRNTSRLGRTEQQYVLTGINAITAGPTLADYTIARSRQGKDQENIILTNQTNLTAEFATGAIKHSLVGGMEFIFEKQTNYTMAGVGTQQAANLYNPSVDDPFQPVSPTGAWTKGSTLTAALYTFDTLKVNEWLQFNGGLRWEKYKTETDSVTLSTLANNPTLPVNTPIPSSLAKTDDLLTYKLGVLFKPASNGSIYLAYANSEKPPGSDSFSLAASGGTGTSANGTDLDPQVATNLELGTKWDLLDNRLALTAAIYKAENKNDIIQRDTLGQPTQSGNKTVNGIEIGAAGMITPAWQLSAGAAWMDTEVVANANNATQEGQGLPWSPEFTFTSWTTYKFPVGLTIGGGARYVDSMSRNSTPVGPTTAGVTKVPGYTVVDAMASYEFNKNFMLQFNAYNLFDKFYVSSLNNGGSRYIIGTPRSFQLTGNVTF